MQRWGRPSVSVNAGCIERPSMQRLGRALRAVVPFTADRDGQRHAPGRRIDARYADGHILEERRGGFVTRNAYCCGSGFSASLPSAATSAA